MDHNTLAGMVLFIFIIGVVFTVAFVGISVIMVGFIMTLLFSCSPDKGFNTEQENYSVEQLVKMNKNFQDSGRLINSKEEAEKYKISSKTIYSNDMINEYVSFDYKGKKLYTKIENNDSLLCFKTVSELGEAYKDKVVNIQVNNEKLEKVIRSQSNIEYACGQDETIIENGFEKTID